MNFNNKIEGNWVFIVEMEEERKLNSTYIWKLRIGEEIFANMIEWKAFTNLKGKNLLLINLLILPFWVFAFINYKPPPYTKDIWVLALLIEENRYVKIFIPGME